MWRAKTKNSTRTNRYLYNSLLPHATRTIHPFAVSKMGKQRPSRRALHCYRGSINFPSKKVTESCFDLHVQSCPSLQRFRFETLPESRENAHVTEPTEARVLTLENPRQPKMLLLWQNAVDVPETLVMLNDV